MECAFELGPHVFPFTPSAGTAQGEHIRSGRFDNTESISWVSMLRFRLIFFLFLSSAALAKLLTRYCAQTRQGRATRVPWSLRQDGDVMPEV